MNFWKSRKVLVTGGAGFLGSNLVGRLVKEGARVRVADNLERGCTENLAEGRKDIEFLELDLRKEEACLEASRGSELVFHLAAKVGGFQYYVNHADEVYQDNLLMDRFMLKAVETNRVSRYFYASSAHIYPSEKQESSNTSPLREGDTQGGPPPISYGSAKRLGEQAVEFSVAKNESLRAACLRLIGAYGRHQDIDLERGSVIPVLIRRAIEYPKRKPFLLKTSGEERRSFCYVSDVVEAMLRSVEKLTDRRFIGPLNVGSEDSIRIVDLAQQIIRLSGKQIDPVQLSHQKSRIQSQRADCSKARVELDGWSPKISLIEGLRLTFMDVEKRSKPGRGGFRNRPTASRSPLQKHLRGGLT